MHTCSTSIASIRLITPSGVWWAWQPFWYKVLKGIHMKNDILNQAVGSFMTVLSTLTVRAPSSLFSNHHLRTFQLEKPWMKPRSPCKGCSDALCYVTPHKGGTQGHIIGWVAITPPPSGDLSVWSEDSKFCFTDVLISTCLLQPIDELSGGQSLTTVLILIYN